MKKKTIMALMIAMSLMSLKGIVVEADDSKISSSANLDVVFDVTDSIEITLSSNEVNFGEVTGLVSVDKDITATVKSSAIYSVGITPLNDFVKQGESDSIEISKLGFDVDSSNSFKNFTGKDTEVNMVSNQPATYDLTNCEKDFNVNFKLDDTIGEKSGDYKSVVKFTAVQD